MPHPTPTGPPAVRSLWECDYRHDRRKQRHRCMACSRILQAGQRALMVRVRNRTKAVHAECSGVVAEPASGMTYRDLFEAWTRPVGLDALAEEA